MKRFLCRVFIFSGLVGLLAYVAVCVAMPRIQLFTASFDGWYRRGMSVHRPSDKPRLILVGGSNLACGIDAAMLSKELKECYRVVNLGFHAGLGVGVHLDLIDAGLRSGDCVALMVEYHNWSRWNGGLPATVFRCDVQGHNLFASMRGSQWCTVDVRQWHHYIMEKWHKLVGGTQLFSTPDVKEATEGRKIVSNEATDDDVPDPSYAAQPVYLTGSFRIDDLSLTMLTRLSESYKERGVRLLLSAPSYDERRYALHQHEIEQIYERISSISGIIQISDPRDYAFPLPEMGNTEWHLNRIGREKMTQRLARDITRAGL